MVGFSGKPKRSMAERLLSKTERVRLRIEGVVQGVGFRPHVYRLANLHQLAGSVLNDTSGVIVEVEGESSQVSRFCRELISVGPPASRISRVTREQLRPKGLRGFKIHESEEGSKATALVSPDLYCCSNCLREMSDPLDRRYRYPFINCTNCGPRYTIIQSLPYDRASTTMSAFHQCDDCLREYQDPADRRFHAQPNACPECGPRLSASISETVEALVQGRIVAIKGIGGYHLACDAYNEQTIQRLREGKSRLAKPFAVMVRSLETASELAEVDGEAASLLSDPARPIVLLPSRRRLPEVVAPGVGTIGLMLPYSPLHYLLLSDPRLPCLVMTSANEGGLPLVADQKAAEKRLVGVADQFLHHDRSIEVPCDDSVMRRQNGRTIPLRRSRGVAPYPVALPFEVPPSLAVGAQMKSTFALGRGREVFLSQHLGDLENLETLDYFQSTLDHFKKLYRLEPEVLYVDSHPAYLSRRWAERQELPIVEVQHHHAHMASCMAEHGLGSECRVLAVILDGTGYGTDGTVWGGEILRGGYADFERVGFLKPVPLPGGDKAVREPWRMALSHLWAARISWDSSLPPVRHAQERVNVLQTQLEKELNTVATSSAGRLFDAVAALIGLRQVVDFEAQAAMELESIATESEVQSYSMGAELDPRSLLEELLSDLRSRVSIGAISMRFHRGLAGAFVARVRELHQGEPVVLSGGVFQNSLLLELMVTALNQLGIEPLVHHAVPSNDGGLSLGQLAVGAARSQREGGLHVFGSAR